jgi:hypothetical protein
MDPTAPRPASEPQRRGWLAALAREVRRHPIGYAILLAFVLLGPVLVHMIFPDVSPLLGLVGGLAFGIYAALSAVPDRFFE